MTRPRAGSGGLASGPCQPCPMTSRRRARALVGSGLVFLAVSVAAVSAGLALGMAPATGRSPGTYRGGTSQRTSIVFQVARGGRRITGLRFGYRLTGSSGCRARSASLSPLPAPRVVVNRGAFSFVQKRNTSSRRVRSSRTIRFRGRFTNSNVVRGSFTVTLANSLGARCRTGDVTYSALARVVEFRIAYPRGTAGSPPGGDGADPRKTALERTGP